MHVRREDVKVGSVFMFRAGSEHGRIGWADGRVIVVKLTIDNTDEQQFPFYQAVVRFIDDTHRGYRDLTLSGPMIDYHLWTV